MVPASLPHPIRLHNLTLGYERHPAVHHVSVGLPAGAMVAVVGPNGAGKSTLVKALAGLLPPMQGHVEGLLPPPSWRFWQAWGASRPHANRVAYLPQQAEMDRSFPIHVADMVAMGLWHEAGAIGRLSPSQRQRVQDALAAVGLSEFGHRNLATLSGGQFQRALFARLSLQDAPVLLLDEPFVGVDSRTVHDLMQLLVSWNQHGRTVVVVLHDMQLVQEHFPTTWLLARELVAAGPTAQVLTEANLARARNLNEAFDDNAPPCEVPDDDLGTLVVTHTGHMNAPHGHASAASHAHSHSHAHTHAHGHPEHHHGH